MPRIFYKSENQNLITYENNVKVKGDLSFSAYFDFETTTANTCSMFNFDVSEMYPVSYCVIFIFHPKLNIRRIVIMRSFLHSLNQLNDISYLNRETLEMRNIGYRNNLYNIQDNIILCKIFQGHVTLVHKRHGFDPRQCNSVSTLSNCIQRDVSSHNRASNFTQNCWTAHKTLNSWFSCINTRLVFYTKILMLNLTSDDFDKMSIDNSFTKRKGKIW